MNKKDTWARAKYEELHMLINAGLASDKCVEISSSKNKASYRVLPAYKVERLVGYFCYWRDEDNVSIFEDFFINSLLMSDAIIAFLRDDDDGQLKSVNFNSLRKQFITRKKIRNPFETFLELDIDRESLLLNIDWEYLLVKTGHLIKCNKELRLKILNKITEIKTLSYPKIIDGIVELIYIANSIEFKKRVKPYKLEFRDGEEIEFATPLDENCFEGIDSKKECNVNYIAGTALGIIIEDHIKQLMKEGFDPKPREVFASIFNNKPWTQPIHQMEKGEIWWHVPTTGELKKMTSKTFANAVKTYKNQLLGKAKK